MEIPENEKLSLLRSLYQQAYEEVKRYRDLEWKICYWIVTLMAGIVVITRLGVVQSVHKPYIQTLLFIFTVVAASYGIWHICFAHSYFNWNRKLRRKCERIFKFHESNIYDDKAILPEKWKAEDPSFWQGWAHLISWWGLIVVATIYACYSIVFIKVS